MIVHHSPVWRCVTTTVPKDWFIAGHAQCARTERQRTIIRNVVADSHVHHSVVWRPENRGIRCRVGDRRRRVRSRRSRRARVVV